MIRIRFCYKFSMNMYKNEREQELKKEIKFGNEHFGFRLCFN